MTKLRDVGSAYDILDKAVHRGGGAKAIAAFENVTKFTIYKQLNPDDAMLSSWSFERVLRLARTFPGFAVAMCEAFAILARGQSAASGDVEALINAAKESAEALAVGWAAIADGKLTVTERRKLRQEINEAVLAFLALDRWLAGDAS